VVKFVAFMRRIPSMDHQEFVDYHRNQHAKIYMEDPTNKRLVRKYIQSHVVPSGLEGLPQSEFDGVTEIWFDTIEDMKEAFSSDTYMANIRPDEQKFIDFENSLTLVTIENPVWNPTN
jgi:uncharacterized protein (TIGR02118 family)